MGFPGKRDDGGDGGAGHDLAVGRARARPPAGSGAGVPSRRAKGVAWKPPADTSRGVPVSSTSWMRHSSHIPCAKCG